MSADDGLCGVRWCTEAADHPGPHRRCLVDTFAMDVQSGRPTIMQLWLQGESARTRALVLVTGECATGLTWSQAESLSNNVASAHRRFAS
jgi:hypothetical protein